MLPERLAGIATQGVAADTETYLIRAGNLVPPLVLGSVAWYDNNTVTGKLLDKEQTLELWAHLLEDVTKILAGANIAFDLAILVREFARRGIDVLPHIFRMLMGEHEEEMSGIHDGRVFDIQHAEALHAIALGVYRKDPRTGDPLKGRYSQKQVVQLRFDRDDAKKNDKYRLRYGEFDGVPLDQLPPEAQEYPVDDVVNCFQAVLAQCGVIPTVMPSHTWGQDGKCTRCLASSVGETCWGTEPHLNLHDLAAQTATAFTLHMGAAHGFRVDQSYVDVIDDHARKNYEEGLKPFLKMGLVRKDGTEDRSMLKRMVAVAYGSSGTCPTCAGTGKVPSPANPKSKIICFQMAPDGATKLKTCDGTGLLIGPNVPTSEKGGIGYGRSFLVESGDETLMSYASLQEDMKTRSVYVPFLRTGRVCVSCDRHGTEDEPHADGCLREGWRDIPLTLRPDPILDTKRISYDGAILLFPRKPAQMINTYEIVEVPDDYVLQSGEEVVA